VLYAGKSDAEATTSDPGYTTTRETLRQSPPAKDAAPSVDSDPFPLPFDPRLEGLSLSSKHQLEDLTRSSEDAFPLRVPGREPGDESREVKVARLRYQIRHRGILETDLLLSTFAKEHLDSLSDMEMTEFDTVRSLGSLV
jgi:succinate dehydrogenase assembly factor 2